MQTHISHIAKQRISDFFTNEDGNVGRKNALVAGTLLSGAMLASTLLTSQTATAGNCGDGELWCGDHCIDADKTCCSNCDLVCCPWDVVYFYFGVDGNCPAQQDFC